MSAEQLSLEAAEVVENRAGPSGRSDPETSGGAARANAPRSGTQRARVLDAIDRCELVGSYPDGITDQELEYLLDVPRPSPGNRRGELVKAGLVEDSGVRRSTTSGNPAVVWRCTPRGVEVARELRAR